MSNLEKNTYYVSGNLRFDCFYMFKTNLNFDDKIERWQKLHPQFLESV